MITTSGVKRLVNLARGMIRKNDFKGNEGGVICRFIKISESWGVKFSIHMNYNELRETFTMQRRAWRVGLAPYCCGVFSISTGTGKFKRTYFGFLVQLAETCFSKGYFFGTSSIHKYENVYKKWVKISKQIKRRFRFEYRDYHGGNLAFIGNKLVVIDWGKESTRGSF